MTVRLPPLESGTRLEKACNTGLECSMKPVDVQQRLQIEWDSHRPADWADYMLRCPDINILQTPYYAKAIRHARQQMPRFGLIRIDGVSSGIVQIQEIRLGPLHFITLDRGPLWFADVNRMKAAMLFFHWFGRTWPRRVLRWRRVLPELPDTPQYRDLMQQAGFQRCGDGWHSIRMDVRRSDSAMLKAMSGSWRNALKAAGRRGVRVEEQQNLQSLPFILHSYGRDRAVRGYPGPAPSFLAQICRHAENDGALRLYLARSESKKQPSGDHDILAWVLMLCHGAGATYQAGWSGQRGRDVRAHNLLLFNAMKSLRNEGFDWLDLGGINPEHAEGVTMFKRGLGGEEYRLLGMYR